MLGGYMGKILRVNLTTGKTSEEPLNEEIARKFIGARGYGAKIIFDEVSHNTDPLGSENKLIFATGPLTLTTAPTGGRYNVCLLYTSDAADEEDSVDLGGRRIIK